MNSQAPEPKTSTADKPAGAESRSPPPHSPSTVAHLSTVKPVSRDLVNQPPVIPDYQLLQRIGGGSYGEVWLARSATGALRALKIVWRHTFDDDRPFQREFEGIQCFERLSREHPSQLALFHVGRGEGYFFYVMELADDGGEMKKEEGRMKNDSSPPGDIHVSSFNIHPSYFPKTLRADLARGRLPAARVLEIALTLTSALHALHEAGLVHRDIKPSNIIFVGGRPKLADIGLVTDTGDARSIVGTEGYLAPEGPGAPQADIFALGKVLYEAATGLDRRQFPQLPPDLRAWPDAALVFELNEIFLRAGATDVRQRYANAEALRADLDRLRGGKSVRRAHQVERRWRLIRRGVGGLAVAAFALTLIALASRVWLPPADPEASKRSTNSFANVQYDIGRHLYQKNTEPEIAKAAEYFQAAIKADPNFVLAQAALAAAWSWSSVGTNADWALLPQANEIAERALAKDNTLSEAHLAKATHAWIKEWRYPKAEKHYKRAIQCDPKNPQPHEWYGLFLRSMGRTNDAIRQLETALRINPQSVTGVRFLGDVLLSARRYSEAVASFETAVKMEPSARNLSTLGNGLLWDGQIDKSLAMSARAAELHGEDRAKVAARMAELKRTFRDEGPAAFWRIRLEILRQKTSDPVELAEACAAAGLTEEALDLLERAYRGHHLYMVWDLKTDPQWDNLRSHERFKALLKKLQLD